ncbi:hypothetical protein B0T11DRAFT_93717 [Plectosphaerella cucumerina]|uniref:Heterokaryon incompatibility domain-containing protein n=1 Tax=Plectosphaerella cucumerina TaxID=40658 RepID=A0A8K0TGA2_9PEZI|nr:hypothetical protein B0T11DRAFT_93717 [Plectosphaerella cucumerina]
MALIYTGAAQVLVLDRDLENLSLEENTADFLVASTVTSKWNTRCWTLQEGVLARECLFQFKDASITISMEDQAAKDRRRIFQSAVPVWEMIKDFYNDNLSSALRASGNVAEGVEGPFYGMEPAENISADVLSRALIEAARFVSGQRLPLVKFFYNSVQPDDLEFLARFADTWNLLGRRQTTLPKDLHAIFANLTNVSFAQLRDVEEPVQRTKVILNSLKRFPTEILYNEYDRPLAGKDCPDRWVPSHPGPEQVFGMTTLVPTPDGLFLEAKPGFQSGFTHTGIILANRGSMILSEFTVRINWEKMRDIMEVSLQCLAPENDELPRHVNQRACLSLDIHYTDPEQLKTGAAQVRGARFLILSESDPDSEGRVSVRTRFDCPVRGTIRSILGPSGVMAWTSQRCHLLPCTTCCRPTMR